LPLSLIGAALRGFDAWGLAAVLTALGCRLFLRFWFAREFELPKANYALTLIRAYSRPPLVRGFLRLFLECARQLARKGFHRQARRHHGGGGWLRETSKWDYEIMRALLLRAPSFDGFEGGAGSRWEFASLAFGATE
jgi:hypothetical protein